jgi:short-subunit dehydrogenase
MAARFDELKDLAIFEKVIQVNFLGSVYCTFYALPYLKKTNGRLVGVCSQRGLFPSARADAYGPSKHAMVGFFDSLRVELRGTGVSVTVVAPDFVVTEIHRRAIGADGRPLGVSPLVEGAVMTADECAARIVPAIVRRERLVVFTLRARLGRWVKLVAPGLVDLIAARAISRRR